MPKNEHKLKTNQTANTVVDVVCIECKRSTKHKVLASADVVGKDWFDHVHSVDYGINFQIVQCQGCESITFRRASTNSEDFNQIGPEDWKYVESVELYPNRNEGRNPLKDVHLLPSNVQRIYDETIKAMNNSQPVLAGIGIRALIETICKDKKAKGRNLIEKIDDLVNIGVLTDEGAKILHKIRTLGNDATHEVKPHTNEQLGLALDVSEHLIQGVYILPHYASRTFK